MKQDRNRLADSSELKFGINYQKSYNTVMKTELFRALLAVTVIKATN